MRNIIGQFAAGHDNGKRVPVGTVRIRTRRKRGGERRAWVKVAEPNVWILRAQWVWEQAHGPLPRGMTVHHKDRDKLNDALENLEALSKGEHVSEHRAEWEERRIAAVRAANTGKKRGPMVYTKRVGRPAAYPPEAMQRAVTACQGGMTAAEAARRFGVTAGALHKRLSRLR